jgi:VIT1/CCC1 family predicted Fe2+/Mn2+ transporter
MSKAKKKTPYNWLPDFVYGGIDGAITTFAVVAGVAGAKLSTPIILILGFANLIADGFSMAVGKYSSDKSEIERIRHITKMEERSIQENPKEEKEEIREILRQFGFKGRDLTRAERIITSDKEAWIHMMLHHEFHVVEENIQPYKGAAVTFLAFIVVGFIPLCAYVFQNILPFTNEASPEQVTQRLFITTSLGTLFALFLVGTVKSKFSERHWIFSGLETALIGGVAAGLAYGIGHLLGLWLGVS